MLPDSTQNLIAKLWEMNEREAIPWLADGSDGRSFETEGYRVKVRGTPARLDVQRLDGYPIEVVEHDHLIRTAWPNSQFRTYADVVQRLEGVTDQSPQTAQTASAAVTQSPKDVHGARTTEIPETSSIAIFGAITTFVVAQPAAPTVTVASEDRSERSAGDRQNVYAPWA